LFTCLLYEIVDAAGPDALFCYDKTCCYYFILLTFNSDRMKLVKLIMNFLLKRKRRSSLFSDAFSEAFKEASREMGYHINNKDKI